ncbi:hypothetical protein H4R34_002484 [Dimargaris verticillata]|uniref:Transcription initiation factor TFIID subunit 1 histone acetyltransferase domain-containing protein n=1 Tax=Dimargaris verticillata TaxID=2761393 RepID=A0A9W8B8R1_9FUNG|nr:hypothetical protein H4R34_002484 [Dimargaris verticillata]
MSFARFLFGNVDKEGELEGFGSDDDDVKATLTAAIARDSSGDSQGLFQSLLGGSVFNESATADGPVSPQSSDLPPTVYRPPPSSTGQSTPGFLSPRLGHAGSDDAIKPMNGAIDFSDFNELAEDDLVGEDDLDDELLHVSSGDMGWSDQDTAMQTSPMVLASEGDMDWLNPLALGLEGLVDDPSALAASGLLQAPPSPAHLAPPPPAPRPAGGGDLNDDTLENLFNSPGTSSLEASPVPSPSLPAALVGPPSPVSPTADVRTVYPGFDRNQVLRFTEMFIPRIERSHILKKRRVLPQPALQAPLTVDQKHVFEKNRLPTMTDTHPSQFQRMAQSVRATADATDGVYAILESSDASDNANDNDAVPRPLVPPPHFPYAMSTLQAAQHPLDTDEWERQICWDGAPVSDAKAQELTASTPRNRGLLEGGWEKSIIWDRRHPFRPFSGLVLDTTDPHMLFEPIVDVAQAKAAKRKALKGAKDQLQMAVADEAEHRKQMQRIDKFNLSNDFFYAALQEGKVQRVRQTFGQLDLQHSIPALKLQPPLYKIKLTKADLRSWHRPHLSFPLHEPVGFSKLKTSKKHKRKLGGQAFKTTRDLTLKDTTPFILLEFSEEHPPIMSNAGMGSLLLNYYRKRDLQDQTNPQLDIGESFILDPADASPFFNFGNVEPGQTIPTLYNNLVRAPLFRHTPNTTDFLLIQSKYKGHTKLYLRPIASVFTVGQTYPMQEVPGPHSRKVTNTIKSRLQALSYRLIRRNPYHRLHMSKVARYFPEYPDTHIRLRLKEFLEFQRKGNNSGFWKLKPGAPLPTEEDVQKLLTPEMHCLYESMLVGECHLRDAGYGRSLGDDDEGTDESMSRLSVEEQLAPWITTRNFINATQGKAMLKLYGEGDPTGRGEGFSFIRVSMKDIFLRAGETVEEKLAEIKARPKSAHRYNVAEQQQIYREEIKRIWNAQFRALSNRAELSPSEDEADQADADHEPGAPGIFDGSTARSNEPSRATSPALSVDRSSVMDLDDDTASVTSKSSLLPADPTKRLVIRRWVRSPMTGEMLWQTEVIKDRQVINAYLRQRRIIESDQRHPSNATDQGEGATPLSDTSRQRALALKDRVQQQLESLQQRRQRRLSKEKARKAMHMTTMSMPQPHRQKKETIRRCGNCGQLGHMKTNRKCPKFSEMMAGLLPPR